jgi:uncharacterized protein involved in outer membrane biogenesis
MRWKWVLLIGIFLVIALVATVCVILNSYDYNKLKPQIARMVKEYTGRELNLGGEITLDFGFSTALVVKDVTFANASWGSQPEMITVERLEAQVRLLALMFGDLKLKKISLAGVDALLETNQTGSGNWDFTAGGISIQKPGAFRVLSIDITGIKAENVNFSFRDGKTGSITRLNVASLDIVKQEPPDELLLNLQADYNKQTVELSGRIGLLNRLFMHQNFPLELRGQFSNAKVEIYGTIKDGMSLQGIDLQIHTSGSNLARFELSPGLRLPETDAFEATGVLKGSAENLRLEGFHGNLSGKSSELTISGNIGDLVALNKIDLELQYSGKDLAEMGLLIGKKLPATDEFTIQGRLTGSSKALSFQQAHSRIRQNSLSLNLDGEINNLLALGGINLQIKGEGKNLANLKPIFGRDLPETNLFSVQGRLMGSSRALSIQEAQGSIRRNSLQLDLNGEIKDLMTFSGINVKLKGSGKDLAEVEPIIRLKLPKTDAFSLTGRLTGSTGKLTLQGIQASATSGRLKLNLQGRIKDLPALSGMDLKLKGSGKDLVEVGSIIGEKLPETGAFTVQGRLMGSLKDISLQEMQGQVGRGGMMLSLQGEIKDLQALQGMNLKLKASGKELAEIEALIGIRLPLTGPFFMSGHLSGSTKAISLHGISAVIDRSDFNGFATVTFQKRPKIILRLESAVVDFSPLLKSLKKEEREFDDSINRAGRLFPADPLPFDALKKVDADIVLKARNIHARDARFEFGHFSLTLENGDLNIDTLEATYKQMKLTGNLQVNPGSPSQVITKFLVQNFDLGQLLKEIGASDQVQALIDIAVDVKSRGDSVQTLMADLTGSIGAVMGKGFLTKYLDLLSMNLSQRVIQFWGNHKQASNINCAVVQFDIKSGAATSRAFVFDTQLGILRGEGTISLGTEQVNFLLVPKSKNPSLVSLSTNLRVTGSIMDPKVKPDMLSLATKGAKLLSTLAIGPLGLLAPFVSLGAYQKHPCEVRDMGQKSGE